MMGIMMWIYDTFEQERLYPAMEDKGRFLERLADFIVDWKELTGPTEGHRGDCLQ